MADEAPRTRAAGSAGPADLTALSRTEAAADPGAVPGYEEPLRGPEVAELVAQAQGGDPAAFERLISLYQTKVYGFARALTSDPEQASDMAQDALIKIYRSIGGFRFQSSLSTWIFRIVKNVFLDHAKSRRHKERKLEQPLETTSERETTDGEERGPEAQLLRHEERKALWDALQEVPELYRTVLVLVDMQGLSYEEVAAVVEAPVGTVKSRLNRGREALRELLVARRRKKAYTTGERP
jgi:RNA polymerase sigma-70 factor (ECF subfamily)